MFEYSHYSFWFVHNYYMFEHTVTPEQTASNGKSAIFSSNIGVYLGEDFLIGDKGLWIESIILCKISCDIGVTNNI